MDQISNIVAFFWVVGFLIGLAAFLSVTFFGPAYLVLAFFATTFSDGQKMLFLKRINIIMGVFLMTIIPLYFLVGFLWRCKFHSECLLKPLLVSSTYRIWVSFGAAIYSALGIGICQRIEFDTSGKENITGFKKMWKEYPKFSGIVTALASFFGTYDPNFFALSGLFFALLAPLENSYKKWFN